MRIENCAECGERVYLNQAHVLNRAAYYHIRCFEPQKPLPRRERAWMVVCIVLVLALVLGAFKAFGHDPEHPELAPWYAKVTDQNGTRCCDDEMEAEKVEKMERRGGHYHIKVSGQWYEVPDYAVIKGPNMAGRPTVWMLQGEDGTQYVRCFAPDESG